MEDLDNNKKEATATRMDLSAVRHIIYTYEDFNKYLENVTSFIAEGIEKKQVVICIDRPERFDVILHNLKNAGFSDSQIKEVIFVDSDKFFDEQNHCDIERITKNVSQLFDLHVKKGQALRSWGFINWSESNHELFKKPLHLYEYKFDCCVSQQPAPLVVCAYNAQKLPGSFMNLLLQTHEFHMTDTDLSPSHLYNKEPVLLPEISEQIRLEEAAEDDFILTEKLDTASKFAANIAHELGNSVAVMKGFMQLIDKTGDMNDTQKGYFHTMSSQLEKLEQIASESLALANPHLGNKEETNIFQLVENVKALLEPEASNQSIVIETDVTPDNMTIVGDEKKLKLVLTNLIKNAIEAMHQGFIKIQVKDMANYIHIDVIDNGPGIPKDMLDQLGEPFVTTKKSGTGLGLLISKKIIAAHNGKLAVESEAGKGTVVTISLPKSR